MIHERVYLDKNDDRVYIDTYVANDRSYMRDAMLVIPGGGYGVVCPEREGEPVALAYMAYGFNTFVLNYKTGREDDLYPQQLIDAGRAIVYIKKNAYRLGINADRVFVVGFSAGGHLAGSCAIMYSDPEVKAALGISGEENKPCGAVLAYPVVTANTTVTNKKTFENLLGKPFNTFSDDERKRFSLETAVNESSAPMFLWHTAEDTIVPVDGTLLLAQAAKDAGIKVCAHIYPYGPHAIALGNEITEYGMENSNQPLAQRWLADSVAWIKTL